MILKTSDGHTWTKEAHDVEPPNPHYIPRQANSRPAMWIDLDAVLAVSDPIQFDHPPYHSQYYGQIPRCSFTILLNNQTERLIVGAEDPNSQPGVADGKASDEDIAFVHATHAALIKAWKLVKCTPPSA